MEDNEEFLMLVRRLLLNADETPGQGQKDRGGVLSVAYAPKWSRQLHIRSEQIRETVLYKHSDKVEREYLPILSPIVLFKQCTFYNCILTVRINHLKSKLRFHCANCVPMIWCHGNYSSSPCIMYLILICELTVGMNGWNNWLHLSFCNVQYGED